MNTYHVLWTGNGVGGFDVIAKSFGDAEEIAVRILADVKFATVLSIARKT